jgi:hypothetical protein
MRKAGRRDHDQSSSGAPTRTYNGFGNIVFATASGY